MYFDNKNNFFHGIMFHHFHDDKIHKKSQGSINKDTLYKLIKFIGKKNILNADDFFQRFKEKKLTEKNLCLTFDDGIGSQYDIALPVLEDLKIKSFFFVYSSLFLGEPDLLEVYRYFRLNCFKDVDEFYELFFKKVNKNINKFFSENEKTIQDKKNKFSYYSVNDIKFRIVRDNLLNRNEYKKIMFQMFEEKKFEFNKFFDILFINKKQIIQMHKLGHTIGLHSHTHPTLMEKLSFDEQLIEYQNNIDILSKILECKKNEIKSMSHPCGSYNKHTLDILNKIGIELGFKQIMTIEKEKNMKKINNSKFEIARKDHSEIIKLLN